MPKKKSDKESTPTPDSKIPEPLVEQAVEQVVEQVVEKVVEKKLIEFQETRSIFSGPIPSPDLMKEYHKVDKSFPNRIMTMAEDTLKHRQDVQHRELDQGKEIIDLKRIEQKTDSRNSLLGITSAFIICIIFTVLTYVLISNNHPIIGSAFGIGTLTALVGTFVHGTKIRKVRTKIEIPEEED